MFWAEWISGLESTGTQVMFLINRFTSVTENSKTSGLFAKHSTCFVPFSLAKEAKRNFSRDREITKQRNISKSGLMFREYLSNIEISKCLFICPGENFNWKIHPLHGGLVRLTRHVGRFDYLAPCPFIRRSPLSLGPCSLPLSLPPPLLFQLLPSPALFSLAFFP